ncbi:MAG TPA: hypothetical protein VFG33_00950 [Kribbella sp.]|uniref:hypothetical protein n=1 Tax=Kribbella sp. TaxID=1871183 RepID=UPI002D7A154B|nr:hypothetical protein [Kribbella sp.]HET6291898.1 hypothetical protein [Kribbella sp.]
MMVEGSRRVTTPPNVAFWVVGTPTMVVGVLVAVRGVVQVMETMEAADPVRGSGPDSLADGASSVVWGAVILTIGMYLWRAAGRRGLQDGIGRLLIIAGYLLLGIALSQGIHVAVGVWSITTEEAAQVLLVELLVTFLAWSAPAALLIHVGTRLAREKVLMTASMSANLDV